MEIKIDDLKGKAIAELLEQHHQDMLIHSPPESVHALDLSALQAANVTFYSAWIQGELAGCGALKKLANGEGEIKSMRTSRAFLRQGVAVKILTHILAEAKKSNYKKINLETGTKEAFIPAINLYKRFGFSDCEPFSDYIEDPYSTFMSKNI